MCQDGRDGETTPSETTIKWCNGNQSLRVINNVDWRTDATAYDACGVKKSRKWLSGV